MINPFINGYRQLLSKWKELRDEIITSNSDIEALQKVVGFWSLAPLVNHVLDWDDPANWPTPWEMLHMGLFDESSVTIGMFYTLLFADQNRWDSSRLRLLLIRDNIRHEQKIVLEIDKKWLLNFEYNCVVNKMNIGYKLLIQHEYWYDNELHIISILPIKASDKPVG
jgi:hypothetical protein